MRQLLVDLSLCHYTFPAAIDWSILCHGYVAPLWDCHGRPKEERIDDFLEFIDEIICAKNSFGDGFNPDHLSFLS
jgi:hypothetical protein